MWFYFWPPSFFLVCLRWLPTLLSPFVTIAFLWNLNHFFYFFISAKYFFSVCELGCATSVMETHQQQSNVVEHLLALKSVWTFPRPANISRSFPVCVLLSEEIGSPGLWGLRLIPWWYRGFTGTLLISQRGNGKTGQSLPAVSHHTNVDKLTHNTLTSCYRFVLIKYTHIKA